jgi:antitoxin FitA
MAILTVRNVSAEVRRALRARASNHDHSTEAEVRQILAREVEPEVRVGDALANLRRKIGLSRRLGGS